MISDIPKHVIAGIKDRVDIVDLVRQHVPLKKVGGDYVACCPFHNEKNPSFTVSPTKRFYHCFGCGAHGDQIDWVMNYLGVPWAEAVARLAEFAGIPLPENPDAKRIQAKANVSKILDRAARWMHQQLMNTAHAKKYVFGERKVSAEAAEQFLIGYAPRVLQDYLKVFGQEEVEVLIQAGVLGRSTDGRMYPKLGGRIIFPIRDAAGWVIGFSGRAMGDAQPKYMNSPDSPFFSKRNEIFRAPDVRRAARKANCVVVTEGYLDVVALYEAGIGYAVAGMGTATTPENLESMFALAPEVVFCLDGDQAGKQAAWRALLAALPAVGDNRLVSFAFIPDGMDPDEFIRARGGEAFHELLNNAVPLSKLFIDAYRRKKDLLPMERHSWLMAEAAKNVGLIKDNILRQGLAASLANVFGVSVAEIQRAGGFGQAKVKRSVVAIPTVRANALEQAYLANLLRRPWEVEAMPPDVELNMPGGTEIVSMLREAKPRQDDDGLVQRVFSGTPFMPLVERLLMSDEMDDDIPFLAKRIEAAWVSRSLEAMMIMPAEQLDRTRLRALMARKHAVMDEIEKHKIA